jgi:hypothetical protein
MSGCFSEEATVKSEHHYDQRTSINSYESGVDEENDDISIEIQIAHGQHQ